MPTVLNFYALGKTVPPGAVYIGRGPGSVWGNPFTIGRDRRADLPELLAPARAELAGKDRVRSCARATATPSSRSRARQAALEYVLSTAQR